MSSFSHTGAPVSAVEEKIRILLRLSPRRKIAEQLRAAGFKPSDLNRAMHPVTALGRAARGAGWLHWDGISNLGGLGKKRTKPQSVC